MLLSRRHSSIILSACTEPLLLSVIVRLALPEVGTVYGSWDLTPSIAGRASLPFFHSAWILFIGFNCECPGTKRTKYISLFSNNLPCMRAGSAPVLFEVPACSRALVAGKPLFPVPKIAFYSALRNLKPTLSIAPRASRCCSDYSRTIAAWAYKWFVRHLVPPSLPLTPNGVVQRHKVRSVNGSYALLKAFLPNFIRF
jgi:hypothetical protein